MATLTEVAFYTRRSLKWGSFLILFLIVFRWAWNGFITYWLAKHPPPPPPPTVAFGKLPPLEFPDQNRPDLTLKLETVTGATPDLGDRVHVFFMPAKRANLLALEAVVSAIAARGLASAPLCFLGDAVNLGPFPAETVGLLRSLKPAFRVRGNHDRYISENVPRAELEREHGLRSSVSLPLFAVQEEPAAPIDRYPRSREQLSSHGSKLPSCRSPRVPFREPAHPQHGIQPLRCHGAACTRNHLSVTRAGPAPRAPQERRASVVPGP